MSLAGPDAEGAVVVEVPVRNASARAGAVVVQICLAPPAAPVVRPARELKGFVKLRLEAAARGMARVRLEARAFAYRDQAGQHWQVAAGEYRISVGLSSADIRGEAVVNCAALKLAV